MQRFLIPMKFKIKYKYRLRSSPSKRLIRVDFHAILVTSDTRTCTRYRFKFLESVCSHVDFFKSRNIKYSEFFPVGNHILSMRYTLNLLPQIFLVKARRF